ncbi:helix-turn-helix domain-containing protein [Candidatus Phycosocius spiralis]|uniref:Transcriptional regulator n=1 Tax=Candidatus Phycosocius spiralis TaxID=2815099 RepID=A0ABQ4PXJ6_9PROT|nr:helix-turn-helix transcriptional regulator [Candidatus Phycosocius spiralis]GIU67671.1 transcriptional regulator [Candidatus Phycosocius spiralis]
MSVKEILNPRKADDLDHFVAQRVRRQRDAVDMTQDQLAQALGISFQQLQKYERGVNRISASRLFQISCVLGVGPEYFYEGVDTSQFVQSPKSERSEPPQSSILSLIAQNPDATDLVIAFVEIKSPKQRQKAIDLIRLLAD